MTSLHKQKGFAIIEPIVILIVIAVVVLAGWTIYHRGHKSAPAKSSTSSTAGSAGTQSPTATDVSSAPAVNSTSDLDKAEQVLDQNDPGTANSSDSTQLSSQASNF